MKLCIRSIALASGILWGGMFLVVGLMNQVGGDYGAHLLDFASSIYPGYGGPAGFGSVLAVTLYGLVDGAVCGAIFAWLYNRFQKDSA
jgi:hypothetical protein